MNAFKVRPWLVPTVLLFIVSIYELAHGLGSGGPTIVWVVVLVLMVTSFVFAEYDYRRKSRDQFRR